MKNSNLEIMVDGCKCCIVRIINTNDYLPSEKENIVYICLKNGKYGIFSLEKEEMIIPFEYDNITYAEDGIYLLIKGGKMGLAHLEFNYCEGKVVFCNKKLITPCEYDFIHTLNSYGKAYVLQKNTLERISVQVYLPWVSRLTEEYERYRYLDEGFIELNRENKRVLIDDSTGDVITDDPDYFTYTAYKTASGNVILDFKYFNEYRLIFIRSYFEDPEIPDQKTIVDFEGDLYVTFEEDECGFPIGTLFKIVHPDGSTTILNNEGIKIEQNA